MSFAAFSTPLRLTENPFRYTPMGIRFVRMIPIGYGYASEIERFLSEIRQLPKKRAANSRSYHWEVRQTNRPLSHVGEAFNRFGKTINGFVGITMFNAVTHTVFDMSLKNNAAAAVQS